jgi:type I restriction enzyme S subunit
VGRLPIPLSPLSEQQRIATDVERRESVIDASLSTVSSNVTRASRLRQSILKRAFEGKLVPQDPNDEPASVLLERIRAERSAMSNERKTTNNSQPRRARVGAGGSK